MLCALFGSWATISILVWLKVMVMHPLILMITSIAVLVTLCIVMIPTAKRASNLFDAAVNGTLEELFQKEYSDKKGVKDGDNSAEPTVRRGDSA